MSDLAQSSVSLVPVNDCVLVKLESQYENFNTREGKYDTRTSGIVVKVEEKNDSSSLAAKYEKLHHFPDWTILLNKRVYFEEYKEGARIKKGGEIYCFIKIEDIRGYEDV